MTAAELLQRVDGVRKTSRGWSARCQAHGPDRNPSLSICEGERGLLLYCFAGCSLDDVCAAIGIRPKDLFYDDTPGRPSRHPSRTEPRRPSLRELEDQVWAHATALDLRGLRTLDLARGLDCSAWSDDDFDRAMAAVGHGYDDLRAAEHLHVLAFGLRERTHKGEVGGQHRAA